MGRKYARQYEKNYLSRQGNGWRFARAVPKALQAIEGRKSWSKYLGVVTEAAALIEARKWASHYDAHIAQLRRLSKRERDTVAAEGPLSNYARVTDILEDQRAFAQAAVEMMPATATGVDEYPGDAAQYLQDVAEWNDLAKASAAKLAPRKRILSKLTASKSAKLTALVDLWARTKKPRNPKTIQKAHLYVARFVKVCGDLEPKSVSRSEAVKYRDALDADGALSRAGVEAHLEKMRTMFNVAIGEHALGIAANPFLLVRSRKDKSGEGKRPFTIAQVGSILEHCRAGAVNAGGVEFELVTMILAYHGARSGEICQLTTHDVTEAYGVPVFNIHGRNGSVKNGATRQVPIHPACLDAIEAQVEIAERTAKGAPDGSSWLFPETVWKEFHERGGDYQRKFGSFLREIVKIKDDNRTLHSLRHTFRDLCREAEMPTDISAAIMGHSLGKGHHGATYGLGVSIKKRADWLKKIDPLRP